MKNRKKIHDDWGTPDEILDYIQDKYFDGNVYFDPCPLRHKFNGLDMEWDEYNYINPPYNRKDKEAFINKALEQSKENKICVMLLPVSTSTQIFHNVILPNCDIEFLKGRVKFKGYNTYGDYVTDSVGQHDSMIVVFRNPKYMKIKSKKDYEYYNRLIKDCRK